jgi:hypothetical protein
MIHAANDKSSARISLAVNWVQENWAQEMVSLERQVSPVRCSQKCVSTHSTSLRVEMMRFDGFEENRPRQIQQQIPPLRCG